MTYFKLFVHVLLMGKGVLISKKVISIQVSKNNALQARLQMFWSVWSYLERKKNHQTIENLKD